MKSYTLILTVILFFTIFSCGYNGPKKITRAEFMSDKKFYEAFFAKDSVDFEILVKEHNKLLLDQALAKFKELEDSLSKKIAKSTQKSISSHSSIVKGFPTVPITHDTALMITEWNNIRNTSMSYLDRNRDIETQSVYVSKDSIEVFFSDYPSANGIKFYFGTLPSFSVTPPNTNYIAGKNTLILRLTRDGNDLPHSMDTYNTDGSIRKSVARDFSTLCPPCVLPFSTAGISGSDLSYPE